MVTDLEFAVARFTSFSRLILEPAIYPRSAPLAVAAMQCAEPMPREQAVVGDYEPVKVGWRWGPAWSTAWFHLQGAVPAEMAGKTVALRFSSGTEAMLWQDGAPRRGFDVNRDAVVLFDQAQGGESIELHVEAACNHPFGITSFAWDPPETQARWESDTPGELQRCELAVYRHDVWRLVQAFDFTLGLIVELPEDSPRAHLLAAALDRAVRVIDNRNVAGTAQQAFEGLAAATNSGAAPSATECFAVGHAHIDTAWLWPIRETKRKCLRSFSNVLELMDSYDDFVFLCSQAQQYAWVEQESPELFQRIAERVQAGRWEAGGAMWIEPDCNVPSGESLVRQIIHGRRYWHEKFGGAAPQRLVYLPDTFGFPASLPQIMVQAGIDTFVTNKMSWNQSNEWPHSTFCWRGLDGSEVLAHFTPGHDYNAANTPRELGRGEKEEARKDKGRTQAWLQPFGYGDGGGGPTAAMIERAKLASACEGLPRVRLSRADSFCEMLHVRRAELERQGGALPVWDGELYLELHRGTYTTQSWIKRANRKAEQALRTLEWLAFAGPNRLDEAHAHELRQRLDEAWKLLLLNQFHDILPGSSIGKVYEDARRDFERIEQFCSEESEKAATKWADAADTGGPQRPALVLNAASSQRSGVVDCDGELIHVCDVPAMGTLVADRDVPATDLEPVRVEDQTLSNGVIEATIDEAGRISSLHRVGGRDTCSGEPLNQLLLYDDVPHSWEAWEIDAQYTDQPRPAEGPAESWHVVESNPLRSAIEVTRSLGQASRLTQRFMLEAGSPRLDIQTHVDWREERCLLRALFPVNVRSRHATYESQFGHIERPTHRSNTWDAAMFEVCAHSWMDLSQPGFGVALLNDCKYGHSCDGNVMGLSLLRSPKHPDPQADMGEHEFTYSLMAHDGDWRAAGVDRESEALNNPLRAMPLSPGESGSIQGAYWPFLVSTDGAASVQVAAIKPAEDGNRLIVRLVETHGGSGKATIDWNLPIEAVDTVDLLERPVRVDGFRNDIGSQCSELTLRPFQIVTLAVLLA